MSKETEITPLDRLIADIPKISRSVLMINEAQRRLFQQHTVIDAIREEVADRTGEREIEGPAHEIQRDLTDHRD